MPRPEKVQAVAEIKERIEDASAVFVTEFRGLSVKQLSQLRRTLRESGADYKVVKMTLARRATDELGIEGIHEYLVGPTGLTFANTDAVATAKVLRDVGKENDKLVIKAGILQGGQVLLPEQVTKLADIEPREVLLSKIAGAAKAPMAQLAGLVGSFTRNAATMFSQLLEKKESDGPAVAPVEPAIAPAAAVEAAPAEEAPDADAAPAAETDEAPASEEAPAADGEPAAETDEAPAAEEAPADAPAEVNDEEPAAAAEEE
jgi:large subunit ribosomal protein L10